MSTLRLSRMREVLTAYVERGEVPGLVALVSHRGETHVECVGYERGTIFRIASMTKPIATAGACTLIEEGRLRLDDSIERLVPELAGRRVLRAIDASLDDTVPAVRPITVRDVLTFTLGTGVVFAEEGTYPIQAATAELHGGKRRHWSTDEYLRRLAALPLVCQPGEAWMYNIGSDVLGALVARAAGRPFGEFLRERIFEPLGMSDTGFWVPPDKIGRLPVAYTPTSDGLQVEDPATGGQFARPPGFESGAGGLVSTVDDFLAFARMLLRRGTPILSAETVQTMTADQLTPTQKARALWTPGYFETHGWGFGVGVDLADHPGQYGWSGGFGTTWRSDPREDLIAILMTQVGMTSAAGPPLFGEFFDLAYSALE